MKRKDKVIGVKSISIGSHRACLCQESALFRGVVARESTMEKWIQVKEMARVSPMFFTFEILEPVGMGDIKHGRVVVVVVVIIAVLVVVDRRSKEKGRMQKANV